MSTRHHIAAALLALGLAVFPWVHTPPTIR